jgi:tripartite-type tricarboxylate transporter receptor subunit TctC
MPAPPRGCRTFAPPSYASSAARDHNAVTHAGAAVEEAVMSRSQTRRAFAVLGGSAALGLVALLTSAPAQAQNYPTKPINIVVPLGAGTGMDTIVRLYGDQLAHSLGKAIVVENKPGAATMLGTAAVAAAPADGYTLLVATSSAMAINPVLYKKINYDPGKDFVPISFYVKSPFVLVVNPALPVHSVPELIKFAKESANPLTYSSPGAGVAQHLSIEFLKQRFGVAMTHVPYRNTSQSITDIAAGHVALGFVEAGAGLPLIRDGKLRALAVSASSRLGVLPEVPPLSEAPGASDFEAVSWHILFAPAATPKEVVDKLHGEMTRIMAAPDMQKKVADLGLIPFATPSVEGIKSYITAEQEKWGSLVRKLGLAGTE